MHWMLRVEEEKEVQAQSSLASKQQLLRVFKQQPAPPGEPDIVRHQRAPCHSTLDSSAGNEFLISRPCVFAVQFGALRDLTVVVGEL